MERKIGNINFKTVAKEWDVYFDMALVMLDEIMKNNAAGKRTVMIVPVGPTDQYPILARMVNQLRVSLKDVWFFNMDEYLISPTEELDRNDRLSFHKRMNDEFYLRIDKELVMPESQRLFPEVGKEKEYDELIATLEVKAAQAELRKKYKAKMALYNLRSLYKRGKELLDNQN